jgi:hypothetical protein
MGMLKLIGTVEVRPVCEVKARSPKGGREASHSPTLLRSWHRQIAWSGISELLSLAKRGRTA